MDLSVARPGGKWADADVGDRYLPSFSPAPLCDMPFPLRSRGRNRGPYRGSGKEAYLELFRER